jgi:small subunit ribosomal protein S5
MELAGVRDALTKCLGSTNSHNSVRATLAALNSLSLPQQVAERRGKNVVELQQG